ncbi:MAG TPA: ABC transporter ATP-binding protein [Candidatus Dormibacteraeota bacterium]|nr:ABC transporter ATP-binding protein [Candidatus Dormibacteraeota bacterium]
MTPALVARALVKEYAGSRALGPLDLTVECGSLVALTGHNGAGKSTLLRLAAGLLDRTGGELTVCGERPGWPEARRLVSFVPDTPVLYEDLGVGELVEYVARLHDPGGWRPRVEQLLERLGLAERADQLPGQLSRGLRQRVALALGLARPSSLLLLDEPFGPLDAAGAEVVAALVVEHVAAGAAAIVSTHQLDLLGDATRTIALRDGVLAEDSAGPVAPVAAPEARPARRRRRRGGGSR